MWLDRTKRIIAAEESITCDDWQLNGAGLAIRLALLRPEPMTFKSWSKDVAGLPPAVWWAAAALCGWRHGYRALDKRFRGDMALQEFLGTRSLAASWGTGGPELLPPTHRASLEQQREDECFSLNWCGRTVLRKPWHPRAKWHSADLTDDIISKAAQKIADDLGWSCFERRLDLPDGHVQVIGEGHLAVDGKMLVVEGDIGIRLPKDVAVVERFDPEKFKRQLATEAGVIPGSS